MVVEMEHKVSMEDIEKFGETYREVFDNNDCIRACGRDKCKKLIRLANLICSNSEDCTKFGDINTGMINIKDMVDLFHHERSIYGV